MTTLMAAGVRACRATKSSAPPTLMSAAHWSRLRYKPPHPCEHPRVWTRSASVARCTRMTQPDRIHYVRIPKGQGGRAEMTRMTYVLAGKPYVDVFWSFQDAREAVTGKNPFKQFPFVETSNGKTI